MGNQLTTARCADAVKSPPHEFVPPSGGGDASAKASEKSESPEQSPWNQSAPKNGLVDHNPGPYEELHVKCKAVQPMIFEGAKVVVQKGLSNHFQVQHTMSMTPSQNGYRLGATYVGTKMMGPGEAYPVLIGDTDLDGNTMGTLIHQFGKSLRCKISTQVMKSQFALFQSQAEYRSPKSTSTLTLGNPDLLSGSGLMSLAYLRRVHARLDLGLECMWQKGPQVPGGHVSAMSYSARYNGDKCTASGTAGLHGVHLCYHHKHDENTQIGIEWETSLRAQESVATAAYTIDIPKANFTVKGVGFGRRRPPTADRRPPTPFLLSAPTPTADFFWDPAPTADFF